MDHTNCRSARSEPTHLRVPAHVRQRAQRRAHLPVQEHVRLQMHEMLYESGGRSRGVTAALQNMQCLGTAIGHVAAMRLPGLQYSCEDGQPLTYVLLCVRALRCLLYATKATASC
jgi:hypothetical protein